VVCSNLMMRPTHITAGQVAGLRQPDCSVAMLPQWTADGLQMDCLVDSERRCFNSYSVMYVLKRVASSHHPTGGHLHHTTPDGCAHDQMVSNCLCPQDLGSCPNTHRIC
jgi:hypothetical protein